MLTDAASLATAAATTEVLTGWTVAGPIGSTSPARIVAAAVIGVMLARWQRLYVAARCAIRSAEFTAIIRTALALAAGSVVLDQFVGEGTRAGRSAAFALLTVGLLTLGRSLFRSWLRSKRALGDYVRPILLVGANHDAARIVALLRDHPEAGFEVIGLCGDIDEARAAGLQSLWWCDAKDAGAVIREGRSTGAIVVTSALGTDELNDVIRDITAAGGHVHISSGIWGIASHRIASEPIAHEPLLHIQPTQLGTGQVALKRCVDVVLATALIVLTAPLLLASIGLIRAYDGGPGMFRQVRVGRNGQEFKLFKLRTMVTDAEARMQDLSDRNQRRGPLFKLDHDPRVTPIGRFLRALSIDELPQLWNVLRGDMSLVGPRPALPEEVQAFPPSLDNRTNVLPGVTGLWQVEARDNPSFDAYARLDLFYVENWTVTLDLVILLATVESEVARLVSRLVKGTTESAHEDEPRTTEQLPSSPILLAENVQTGSVLAD